MPIENTGPIRLRGAAGDGRTDINEEINGNVTDTDVSLGTLNTARYATVADGTTVSGRSMSEMRGYAAFDSAFPSTEADGALGESLLFDRASNPYVNKVESIGSATTCTVSMWFKPNGNSGFQGLFEGGTTAATNNYYDGIYIGGSILYVASDRNNSASGGANITIPNLFTDNSSWYHIVVAYNTTKSYLKDRIKIYVNGIEIINGNFSFTTESYYNQNASLLFNQRITVGSRYNAAAGQHFDGIIADVKFIDGKQLRPDSFGELVQGIWIPKAFNTASTDTLVTSNLVSRYDFIGSSEDLQGSNDGTISNVSFLNNNYGIANFNGSSSYIDTNYTVPSSSTFSISWWQNLSYVGSNEYIFSDYVSSTDHRSFSVFHTGTTLGVIGTGISDIAVSTTTIGSWMHFAVVLNGTTLKIYKNGSEIQSRSITARAAAGTRSLVLGKYGDYIGHTFFHITGSIGEVQIYSSALTSAQALQNYNATKHKYTYGLNGFWLPLNNTSTGSIDSSSNLKLHLDASDSSSYGGSGTTWSDLSGNSANATLSGATFLSSTNGGVFDFDGSNDDATIDDTKVNYSNFSLEFWINPDANLIAYNTLFSRFSATASQNTWHIRGNDTNNGIEFARYPSGASGTVLKDNSVVSINKWTHIVVTHDETSSILKIYKNGALDATRSFSGNLVTGSTTDLLIGNLQGYNFRYNGQLAQVRFYNDILTAQEIITNYRATQGNYEQVSTVDISGNANSFTSTNIDATDHIKDEPLDNYPTLGAFSGSNITLSEGNLKAVSSSGWAETYGTLAVKTGKWYYEVKMTSINTFTGYTAGAAYFYWGFADANKLKYVTGISNYLGTGDSTAVLITDSGSFGINSSSTSPHYGTTHINGNANFALNDIIGISLDADTGSVQVYKNGSTLGNPVTFNVDEYVPLVVDYPGEGEGIFNFGQKAWVYDPPTGFKALSTSNLPAPAFDPDGATPDKPSNYFKAVTYQGNGSTQGEAYGYKEGSRAAVFNGSSSKIDVPTITASSISFWVYLNNFSSTHAIAGNSSDTSKYLYIDTGGTVLINTQTNLIPSISIKSKAWEHIALTESGGTITMYLNGQSVGNVSSTLGGWNQLGARTSGTAQYLDGKLDEVRIFDKALSSTEVGYLADDDTTNIGAISNLVAHYDMEGDANDTGSYLYGTSAIDSGQSAVFNGSSSYIDFGQRILGGTHSASAWVKTSTTGVRQTIIGNAYDGSTYGLSFFIGDSDNKLYLQWSHSNNWINVVDSTANRVNDGNWHHVAYFISAGSQKIYVDGLEVASGTTSSTAQNNTTAPTIIGKNWNASGYFDGSIDQVRIYSSALSASDVEALVSETNVPTANLVAHYKLDGDANDETTNYNGTWGGTEAYSDPAEFPLIAYNGTESNITYTQDKPYGNIDVGFKPDLVWIKGRSTSNQDHTIIDSVRGVSRRIRPSYTASEVLESGFNVTAFDSNGFTLVDNANGNYNVNGAIGGLYSGAAQYIAWAWKAAGAANTFNVLEGGTVTSDSTASGAGITAGSITTGWEVSANRDAGFSIVKWTTTSAAAWNVGHGLSSAPEMIISKMRTSSGAWWEVYHSSLGTGKYLALQRTNSVYTDAGAFSSVTDTTWTSYTTNTLGDSIAYCFHSVDGFSKIGSYTGNGSSDGPFVYTGFKPAWIIMKRTSSDASGGNWIIKDNARAATNPNQSNLYANLAAQEEDDYNVDFYATGFKIKETDVDINKNDGTYIYMAFAEDPVKYSNGVATLGDGNEFIQGGNYPEDNFSTVTYTGDGTLFVDDPHPITGVGFQPDFVWIKGRTLVSNNNLFDVVRGVGNFLMSNNTSVEFDAAHPIYLDSFDPDGFTVNAFDGGGTNQNGQGYVAWSWKAAGYANTYNILENGTVTSSASASTLGLNTGTITPTGVSANKDNGFSIVKYTGNGTIGSTVGHGLSKPPELIFVKNLDDNDKWAVYNKTITAEKFLVLNETAIAVDSNFYWNDTEPTKDVFTIGATSPVNSPNTEDYIAYCWHSVPGFSKIGSYKGNGSSSARKIYTGFEPAFIMIKNATGAYEWTIIDNKRGGNTELYPNTSGIENSQADVQNTTFASDGFILNSPEGATNQNNATIIYMAFAHR